MNCLLKESFDTEVIGLSFENDSGMEPAEGLEPPTFGLQIRCTTSYATQALNCPRHLPLMNETDRKEGRTCVESEFI